MVSRVKYVLVFAILVSAVTGFVALQGFKMLKNGAQAYFFGYPLVLMDETRKSLAHPGTGHDLFNHFIHVRTFPDHEFRQVVRPNNDTLYSSAWLDLTAEPIVLGVPNMGDRYYVMPFMDAWTNVFDSVGYRTTGSGPGAFLVAGPDWTGEAPANVRLIRSPTNMCWILGRIHARGDSDLKAVHALQDRFSITSLGSWPDGKANQALIQHQQPFQNEKNWLSAPADEFAVTMRIYVPKPDFLNGTWKLPFIEKMD